MRQTISISKDFFCDGHCYLLTSASLGGSGLTPEQVQNILLEENKDKTGELLKKGVCLPICFPGDCAFRSGRLDGGGRAGLDGAPTLETKRAVREIDFVLRLSGGRFGARRRRRKGRSELRELSGDGCSAR
jgi:hypothetical protein